MKVMSKDKISDKIKKFCAYLNEVDELVTLYDSLSEFNHYERSITGQLLREQVLQHLAAYNQLSETEKQKIDDEAIAMLGEKSLSRYFESLSYMELYNNLNKEKQEAQSQAQQYESGEVYYLVNTDFNSYPRGQMYIVAASTDPEVIAEIYKQESSISKSGRFMSVIDSRAHVVQIGRSQFGE